MGGFHVVNTSFCLKSTVNLHSGKATEVCNYQSVSLSQVLQFSKMVVKGSYLFLTL